MFILKRSDLEALGASRICQEGLDRHAARALEQEGVDFGGGVVGNGIDTYYPDGFTFEEWERIATHKPSFAVQLHKERKALGIDVPPDVLMMITRAAAARK